MEGKVVSMKEICRDFIVTISVPDHVKPEDCEIVIDKLSASYQDSKGGVTVTLHEHETYIMAESPYEHEV